MSNWTEDDLASHYAALKVPPPDMAPADAGKPADVPEAFIEAECTKILEQDGWRALRTDPVSDRGRGKGFGEVGMSDHLYIRYGLVKPHPVRGASDCFFGNALACSEVLWIEFKRPGEKAKKHQTAWHIRERARGALTLIAGEDFPASVEGFKAWYRNSGLARAL